MTEFATAGSALDLITDPKVILRFMRKIERSKATGTCWNWTGTIRFEKGTFSYGRFHLNGASVHAHRIAYVIFIGSIAPGMDVHHECARKLCVNPQHLSLLSRSDNAHEVNSRTHTTRKQLDDVPF